MKRYVFSIVFVTGALIGSVGFLAWHSNDAASQIAQSERNLHESLVAMDAQLATIQQRKIAEAQAAKEAAATETADEAKTITSPQQANVVDSQNCTVSTSHNNPAFIDVVANKKNCLQPITYQPDDLVTVNGATIGAKAADSFSQMYNAATASGQPFLVTSSYRSYENQITTYQYWVSISGYEEADTYSSRPGYSEHQTGLAIDVAAGGCALDCFGSTTQYAWFQAHAAEYGFVQRYYEGFEAITGYKAEEWHYRYVGVATAQDMQTKGIKTLEEYWGIEGGGY